MTRNFKFTTKFLNPTIREGTNDESVMCCFTCAAGVMSIKQGEEIFSKTQTNYYRKWSRSLCYTHKLYANC